jgi:hypothetical protein
VFDCVYEPGDIVKFGSDAIIDSLSYQLQNIIPVPQPVDDGFEWEPNGDLGSLYWLALSNPGFVEGAAETAMYNPSDGESSYPGIAWSYYYFGSADIFGQAVIKAKTFGANEEPLYIDSRENHGANPLVAPFTPAEGGGIQVTPLNTQWNFSIDAGETWCCDEDCGTGWDDDPTCSNQTPALPWGNIDGGFSPLDELYTGVQGQLTDYYQFASIVAPVAFNCNLPPNIAN